VNAVYSGSVIGRQTRATPSFTVSCKRKYRPMQLTSLRTHSQHHACHSGVCCTLFCYFHSSFCCTSQLIFCQVLCLCLFALTLSVLCMGTLDSWGGLSCALTRYAMMQCPLYRVAKETDDTTLGAARKRIDPAYRGFK